MQQRTMLSPPQAASWIGPGGRKCTQKFLVEKKRGETEEKTKEKHPRIKDAFQLLTADYCRHAVITKNTKCPFLRHLRRKN